ncbi:MAG: M15 family metallopeptidase [Clostridiales bacterium]|nr:M15 family metallopeptidase [Clostridiales bacterium]
MQNKTILENPIRKLELPKKWTNNGFISSKIVSINENMGFDMDLQYPKMKFKNAVKTCFVREEVLERLIIAQGLLPKGYKYKIYDTWRPIKLQEELYENYTSLLAEKYDLESLSEDEREEFLSGFISPPVHERTNPPVHTTGGAIDLTIVDPNGNELDMGTAFDEFTDKTHTAYFENTKEKDIIYNRRMLYNSMTKAGFTNLPSEWWHYDYGDKFWAYYNKTNTLYTGLFTKEELKYEK